MINNNEIHLKKLWIVMKSRGGQRTSETSIWVDDTIAHTLLGKGEITDVDSIQFRQYTDEAKKRWI